MACVFLLSAFAQQEQYNKDGDCNQDKYRQIDTQKDNRIFKEGFDTEQCIRKSVLNPFSDADCADGI